MYQNNNEQWSRLEAVIKWSGLSIHAFSLKIGLKRSENLYRIRSNKNGISRKLASMITAQYPEISDIWLLTSSGSMFSAPLSNSKNVRYYPEGIKQYLHYPNTNMSSFAFPFITSSDFAIDVASGNVSDVLPVGVKVFLREIPVNKVVLGEVYFVVTESFEDFRRVVIDDKIGYFQLKTAPENSDFTISLQIHEIIHIYAIDGYYKRF